MADNDMGHMAYLEAVARGDVAHLRMKEATYRGSWKRRGGVGAFMMLARKIDRLENMAQERTPVYGPGPDKIILTTTQFDIFAMIERKPDGSDGTALAEIRDLRRYLLLIESEMASRGVVTGYERERPTVAELEAILREPDAPVQVQPDGSVRAEPVISVDKTFRMTPELAEALRRPGYLEIHESVPDKLDKITTHVCALLEEVSKVQYPQYPALCSETLALARLLMHEQEIEEKIGEGLYKALQTNIKDLLDGRGDEPLTTHHLFKTKDELIARLRELDERIKNYPQWGAALPAMSEERKQIIGELIREHSMSFADVDAARAPVPIPPGTPEDGGHHAIVTDRLVGDSDAEKRRVPRYDTADEVEPRDGLTQPPRWWSYVVSEDPVSNTRFFNVDRRVAEMKRPTLLRRELNDKEFELTEPHYRGMYDRSVVGEEKWVLRAEYSEKWGMRS
jgi:hypothetical protein